MGQEFASAARLVGLHALNVLSAVLALLTAGGRYATPFTRTTSAT